MPPLPYPERLTGTGFTLRLSTPADAHTLCSWSQSPAVHTHWGGQPLTLDEVLDSYCGSRAPGVVSYLIETASGPVGYIQAWQENGAYGLDMFLAAPAQGQGLGPRVARALASDLTARGWTPLTADPALANARAMRAWARAGFVDSGARGVDDGHETAIMVFR